MENNEPLLLYFQLYFTNPVTDKKPFIECLKTNYNSKKIIFLPKSLNESMTAEYTSLVFTVRLEDDSPYLHYDGLLVGEQYLEMKTLTASQADQILEGNKTKIYVGNIPYPADNHTLWKYFSQYG